MKTCSRCKEDRPDDWYAKHSISKTRLQLYKSYCRSCKTAANRKERLERKLNKKTCVRCNKLLDTEAFDTSKNGLKNACKACEALEIRECRVCHKTKEVAAFRKNGWGGFREECYQCEAESKRTAKGRAAALRCYYARMARDPMNKVIQNLRCATRRMFLGMSKDKHTSELLGCTYQEYRTYIASKFQEGMTMESYGANGWHIDHVIPLASFDIYDPEERARALHYTNTQPMWASENMSKCDKMPDGTLGRFLRPRPAQPAL